MKVYVFLLLIFFFIYGSSIKVQKEITSSKIFGEYIQKSFGMAAGGEVNINYKVSFSDSNLVSNPYPLLLIVNEMQNDWYSDITNDPSSEYISELCTTPSLERKVLDGTGSLSFLITDTLGSDQYSVILLQCREVLESNPVTYNLDLDMLNPRPKGDGHSHLPIDMVMYTRVLEGELILYCLMLIGILGQFYFSWY